MEIESMKNAYKDFVRKIFELKKRRLNVLKTISEKMDEQEIEKIRNEIKKQ